MNKVFTVTIGPDQTVIAQLLGIFCLRKKGLFLGQICLPQKIIVHHSASLGKKQKEEGLPPRLGGEQNMMCKDEFGCVCSQQLNQVSRLWDPILSPARNAVVTKYSATRMCQVFVCCIKVCWTLIHSTATLSLLFWTLGCRGERGTCSVLKGCCLIFSYANKKLSSSHTKPKSGSY